MGGLLRQDRQGRRHRLSGADGPFDQVRLAQALVAISEGEYFRERPCLPRDVPLRPGIAGDGDAAAMPAGIFYRGRRMFHRRGYTAASLRIGGKRIRFGYCWIAAGAPRGLASETAQIGA